MRKDYLSTWEQTGIPRKKAIKLYQSFREYAALQNPSITEKDTKKMFSLVGSMLEDIVDCINLKQCEPTNNIVDMFEEAMRKQGLKRVPVNAQQLKELRKKYPGEY